MLPFPPTYCKKVGEKENDKKVKLPNSPTN